VDVSKSVTERTRSRGNALRASSSLGLRGGARHREVLSDDRGTHVTLITSVWIGASIKANDEAHDLAPPTRNGHAGACAAGGSPSISIGSTPQRVFIAPGRVARVSVIREASK
jgi:hypothetical protein